MDLANALVLQDAFRENGYTDLLVEYDPFEPDAIAAEYGFRVDDFFESDEKPDALLGLFISEQRDDLFLLLCGDSVDVSKLCDEWDKRIRVFTVMNRRSEAVEKLQYNIVQLVVYSGDTPDKSREANLQMSRKIIIKGETADKDHIVIDDEEAIELPFHMISADAFAPDEGQEKRLNQLIPAETELLEITQKKVERKNKVERDGVLIKSMDNEDFDKIRRWLER